MMKTREEFLQYISDKSAKNSSILWHEIYDYLSPTPDSALLKVRELADCLVEAVDLVDGIIDGDYKPDSFTTQPWRKALSSVEHAPFDNDLLNTPPSVNKVSDADIIAAAIDKYTDYDASKQRLGFGYGAKWMRSKLQSKPKDGGG